MSPISSTGTFRLKILLDGSKMDKKTEENFLNNRSKGELLKKKITQVPKQSLIIFTEKREISTQQEDYTKYRQLQLGGVSTSTPCSSPSPDQPGTHQLSPTTPESFTMGLGSTHPWMAAFSTTSRSVLLGPWCQTLLMGSDKSIGLSEETGLVRL